MHYDLSVLILAPFCFHILPFLLLDIFTLLFYCFYVWSFIGVSPVQCLLVLNCPCPHLHLHSQDGNGNTTTPFWAVQNWPTGGWSNPSGKETWIPIYFSLNCLIKRVLHLGSHWQPRRHLAIDLNICTKSITYY